VLLKSTDPAGDSIHNCDADNETAPSELVDTEERVQEALQGLHRVVFVVTITS